MRAFFTSLVLLALLSACGGLPAPTAHPSPGTPLRAWISPPGPVGLHGVVGFQINRPAHVAIFEIVPGRGVGMIYPSFSGDAAFLPAGYHTTWRGLASHRWGYMPSLVYSSSAQPRFLFLVASEAPLRVSNFAASPMGLRGTIGLRQFTAWNPYATMDELTQMILPLQSWGDWTTDLYVEWPEPTRAIQPQYVVVVCRDGRQLLVPAGYGFRGCPGEVATVVRPGDEPSDPEEGVDVPTRRRPEPVAEVDQPRTRPAVAEDEDSDRRAGQRDPRPRERDPIEVGERERERVVPTPVREVVPSREREPRAEPRSAEPRTEPGRGEPRAEPRSEPRPPARPTRSAEPRQPSTEPRPAPQRENRPAPPPRPASEPRAEPRRDPPAPPPSSPAPAVERERPSRVTEPSAGA